MLGTRFLFALSVSAVFVHAWFELPRPSRPGFMRVMHEAGSTGDPAYESRFVTHGVAAEVHAAALTEISHGGLRAFWYGGGREGAGDVAIYSSVLEPGAGDWSRERPLFTRQSTQQALDRYVSKLGNPALLRDRAGRLWLFYVSVSVGGWSGSALNLALSEDDGETWSAPRRLISSPFLNLSTLVRAPPLPLDDGSIALPAYHEFVGLFGEILRLNRDGNVVGKTRLSRGAHSLQPVIVPASQTRAIALMRYAGPPPKRMLAARTVDGGRHWTRPFKTDLPNPNSAISCIRLDDGALLLVFNDSEVDRSDLSLAYSSDDARTWRTLHRFESAPGLEYSYPCLIQAGEGDFHLLYTWRREQIKHVHFNRAWLDERRP